MRATTLSARPMTLRSTHARAILHAAGRAVACVALFLAMLAPGALSTRAEAQFGRQAPTPVSAAQLEGFLRAAGLGDEACERGLRLHEEYFARFRDFESREADAALSPPGGGDFDLGRSSIDARKFADARRRVLQRAAQLDGQLVDEIAATVGATDALRLERVRTALARRRVSALVPSFGPSGHAAAFDLQSSPVLASLDSTTRAAVAPTLDAYDADLTRLCERLADATLARPVRAAELREELGFASTPRTSNAEDEEAARKWFRDMQEIQRKAGEEMVAAQARIRRLHRDTVETLAIHLSPGDAHRLRMAVASGAYTMLVTKCEFDGVLNTIESRHRADGDPVRDAVRDAVAAQAPALRSALEGLMDAAEKLGNEGGGGVFIAFGDDVPENPDRDALERARARFREVDAQATDAIRLAAGLSPEAERRETGRQIAFPEGVAVEGVEFGSVAVMVGGDGEAIVLTGEDMSDSGMMTFDAGMGAPRLAAPMSRAELDALATRVGLAGASRAVFDSLFEECAAERRKAEAEFGGDEGPGILGEGSLAIRVEAGDVAPVLSAPDPARRAQLATAIDTSEERFFDALKASADAAYASETEAARRMRARVRLTAGESGAMSADLVRIAGDAALSAEAQATIARTLSDWDIASVDQLRATRDEQSALRAQREALMHEAMTEVVEDDGKGGRSVRRSVSFNAEIGERMQAIEARLKAVETRYADSLRATMDDLSAQLARDPASQRALRRAYLRAVEPGVYRTARDLQPYFDRAARVVAADEAAREAIEVFRLEWIEAREARCEEFIAARDRGAPESGAFDPSKLQERMRERRRLRGDLEQIEATTHRKLVEFVAAAAGPEGAKEVGELTTQERNRPIIRFGS